MSETSEVTTGKTEARGRGMPRVMVAAVAGAAVSAAGAQRVVSAAAGDTAYLRFAALVLGAALLFTVGGVFMKLSEGVTRLAPSLAMAACFVAGAILQAFAMRGGDLGVVYVIVLGVEAVLAMAFGWFFFAEHLSAWKVGGAALIVAGIATLRAGA